MGEFLWHFFNGYELSTNLAFYDTHIKFMKKKISFCLFKHFLLTLKPKSDDTAQKTICPKTHTCLSR